FSTRGNLKGIVMTAGRWSMTVAFVAILALATLGALATASAQQGKDDRAAAQALHNKAIAHWKQGKYSDAEDLYKRALKIRERALGPHHPDVAHTINNLANVYRVQGKYGEAEGLYKRALAIREKALGANHPDVGQTLSNLANV